MSFNRGKVLLLFVFLLMFAFQGELAAQNWTLTITPTGQSIEVGDTLNLTATAMYGMNPVKYIPVTFSVIQGDGSVLPLVATTNAQGRAYTVFTAGISAGINKVVGRYGFYNLRCPYTYDTVDIEVIADDSDIIDHFDLTVSPDTLNVGEYTTVEITAKDIYNNTITDYGESITLLLTGSTASSSQVSWVVLGDTLTGLSAAIPGGSFDEGIGTVYVADRKAETVNGVKATDTGSRTGTSSEVTWLSNGVDRFLVELLSAKDTINVNDTAKIQVTAVDAFGNVTSVGLPTDVELSASKTGVIFQGGEIQSLDNSVDSFLFVAHTACSDLIITVTNTANPSVYGNSDPIEVTAGDIDHFDLDVSPDTLYAGEYATVEITARDIYDNTVSDYADPITVSLTGSTADPSQVSWVVGGDTLTGLSVGVPAGSFVEGVCTIYFSSKKAETVGMIADDGNGHTGTASQKEETLIVVVSTDRGERAGRVVVLPQGVDSFLVELLSDKPDTINVDDTADIQVTPVDSFGNPTTKGLHDLVVELSASDPGVIFPDGETRTLDSLLNPIDTFSFVAHIACSDLIITVTDTANPGIYGSSDPIEVTAGNIEHLALTVSPKTLNVGEYTTVIITAKDNYGNTIDDYGSSVDLSFTGITAHPSQVSWIILGDTLTGLSAAIPENSFAAGICTVYVANRKAESVKGIKATDTENRTGISSKVTWLANGVDRFLVELLSTKIDTINVNDTAKIQVTAVDIFGNVTSVGLPTNGGLSASKTGVIFSDGEIKSLDNSVDSFSFVAHIACSDLIITVTDIAKPSIYGSSNPIEVVAGGTGVEEIPVISDISAKFGNGEILYSVAEAGSVEIKVYNKIGIEVGTLVNGVMGPGYYQATLNALNLSSDVYFVIMKGSGIDKKIKTALIK